jgi:hypothetical protein
MASPTVSDLRWGQNANFKLKTFVNFLKLEQVTEVYSGNFCIALGGTMMARRRVWQRYINAHDAYVSRHGVTPVFVQRLSAESAIAAMKKATSQAEVAVVSQAAPPEERERARTSTTL